MEHETKSALLTAAAGLANVADVSREVLPELTQATNAALVFLYEASPRAVTVHGPSGTAELVNEYFREYVSTCPLHAVKGSADGTVIATTRIAARKGYGRSPVYLDFFRPHGLDHHLAVRLLPMDDGRGEIGLMLNRGKKQGEFTDRDIHQVRSAVPSLTVALRLARQLEESRSRTTDLEALLFALDDAVPKVLIDADGRVMHVHHAGLSVDIGPIVELLNDPRHPVVQSARALAANKCDVAPSLVHQVSTAEGTCFRAELALSQGLFRGRPLVIVRLVCSPRVMRPEWAQWRLSRAESAILAELVAGATNLEIGARLFISPQTVRTHLTRIFKKLGVRSRLQAAVLGMRACGPTACVR